MDCNNSRDHHDAVFLCDELRVNTPRTQNRIRDGTGSWISHISCIEQQRGCLARLATRRDRQSLISRTQHADVERRTRRTCCTCRLYTFCVRSRTRYWRSPFDLQASIHLQISLLRLTLTLVEFGYCSLARNTP